MKFKSIFFLFNGIILFSFLFITLMPFFVLGTEYTLIFWKDNWFLIFLFLIFIGSLDGYFIKNWNMFLLLEEENWAGLLSYLENEIYNKKRFSKKNIKLFVHTSLSVSNLDKIDRLRDEVRENCPKKLGIYGTILGLPYLLASKGEEGRIYFEKALTYTKKREESQWQLWCLSFLNLSLVSYKNQGAQTLLDLARKSKNSLRQVLSLYLLNSSGYEENRDDQERLKDEFLKKNPVKEVFEKKVKKEQEKHILLLLLSHVVNDSLNWIYGR